MSLVAQAAIVNPWRSLRLSIEATKATYADPHWTWIDWSGRYQNQQFLSFLLAPSIWSTARLMKIISMARVSFLINDLFVDVRVRRKSMRAGRPDALAFHFF